MVGGISLERTFAQHAARRAAGAPVPAVLVGDAVTRAWRESWGARPIVASSARTPEEVATEYLAARVVCSPLEAMLNARVAAARASSSATQRTAYERDVWLAVSRDALIAAGDLDAQALLGIVFASEPPANALRALGACSRVLGDEAPPVVLSEELDIAVRIAVALAESAPAMPIAVTTTSERWRAWLGASGREHAKAMVRPFAVELVESAAPSEPARAVRALLERAKASGRKEDDDEARSAAERTLFDALEAHERSRGLFELNRCLGVKFGMRALEIDIASASRRIAIEIDGYFHFRDPDCYRRDRRKDVVMQKERYFVMRFLAEDVGTRLDDVVEAVHDALAFLEESKT